MNAVDDITETLELAARHGLTLAPNSIDINDMGLDYRVAIVETLSGESWVLRIPRRPELANGAKVESKVLDLVSKALSFRVPQWRIHSPELIAYPLLPGSPGLTMEEGRPVFHIDMGSEDYARDMGKLLSELHSIPIEVAAGTGVPSRTPQETRMHWKSRISRVSHEFEISPSLLDRWDNWINDDSFWPDFSVLTHGEIYAAHTLVDGNRIRSVLDWTTAEIGDPVRDFSLFHMSATREAFDIMTTEYQKRGGRAWPRLADHCQEYMAASAIGYAEYALETGDPEHTAAAQAGLLADG